jgi:putative phosphoribosyl transferase
LNMLLTENVVLPGESKPLAGLTSNNVFTYNNMFSTGEIEEMRADYLSYIEAQRIEKLHHLHMILSSGGEIKRNMLRRRVVILVSDGLSNAFSLDIAAEFLKPIKMQRLIVCTPIASVDAVDRMHLVADEVHCLSVIENYMHTGHYYADNTVPNTPNLLKIMRNTPINWQIDPANVT